MSATNSSRRKFVNFFLGGTAAACLAAVGYHLVRFLTPPPADQSVADAVSAGKTGEYPQGSGKIVRFGSKPALVIRDKQGEFKAFIAVCTHLDCTVQFVPEDNVIWCACHNGKYDLNGINISGPPPRPLTPLKVNIQNDEIILSREA
ncbi:MAG: Rieske 2Fe-2S domain-containing protein [Candidatus Glassbacteria bacterium]|nr:Rieske 2Fe-2S domain-containing protein [Candidatus Glassbacteria bacterium]